MSKTDLVPTVVRDAQGATLAYQWDSKSSLEYAPGIPVKPGDSTVPAQAPGQYPNGISAGTAVGTPPALVMAGKFSALGFELENSGATTITNTTVEARTHPNGAWFTYLNSSALDTTNSQLVPFSDASFTNLAAGAKGHAVISVAGLDAIRLQPTVGSGSTTVNIRASAGYI